MKFEKIHIDGFGALQNLELDGISPGLNIIEGANEAGKTTMLEFVRALFFGFAQRDRNTGDAKRFLPNGGAHGGWAILQNSHNEKLRIDRIGDKTSAGECKVQLLGTDRDINIDVLLNGADRLLYEQIFAFSLDELSGFSQSDERVQNSIYAASSGRGSDSLFSALKRTDDQVKEIYTKRGRNQSLNKALAEYRNLQIQIKDLSGQVEEYNNDREQLFEYQKNAEELREQFNTVKKQLDSAKLYAAVWETWIALSALRNELDELPAQPKFEVAKAAAMPDLKIKFQQQQDAIENLQPRLKRVELELKNCEVDEVILRNAVSIKEIKEQLGTYESTLRALPLNEQKLDSAQQQIKVLSEQLGPGWNEENVEKIDTSREPRLQIQRFEKTVEEQDRKLNEAIQKESATAQSATQQEQSLQRLLDEIQKEFPTAPPEKEELNRRADALREANLLLRNIEKSNLKADFLQKELTEKQSQQDQNQQDLQQVIMPSWMLAVPPVIAVLAGLIFYSQQSLTISIALVLVAIAVIFSTILSSLAKNKIQQFEKERQRYQQSKNVIIDLQKEMQNCEIEIKETNSQLQLIDEKWNWKLQNQSDHQHHFDELSRDREKRARYENLQDDAKRRSGDLDAIREIQKSQNANIDFLKSTFKEQQDKWQEWLGMRQLSAESTPRQTLEIFDFIEKVRGQLRDRNQYQLEIAAKQMQCDNFENAVDQLWQNLQRAIPEKNQLPSAVRALHDELEQQQKRAIQRENLEGNKQQLQDEIETQNNRLQETAKQMEQLLSDADCANQSEFDNKVKIDNRREELQKQCREQERILETHSAPGAAREKLEIQLKNLDASFVHEQLEMAQADFAQAEKEMSQALRVQGEWDNKIQQRERDEGKLTALLRQLEIQKSAIADLTQQWATARLTNFLLDSTRERFEQERQPAVIKRAGELMSNVTAGRYQSVFATKGLNAVELDEGEHGRKPLSRWSRGTREQFYLALRLAFIEDYCSQAHLEPLPVVIDDVLVHADGYQRLEAASAMIAQFAEKYQVLYFTCRPGDAKVLSQVAPAARRLRLERGKIVTA